VGYQFPGLAASLRNFSDFCFWVTKLLMRLEQFLQISFLNSFHIKKITTKNAGVDPALYFQVKQVANRVAPAIDERGFG